MSVNKQMDIIQLANLHFLTLAVMQEMWSKFYSMQEVFLKDLSHGFVIAISGTSISHFVMLISNFTYILSN